MSSAGDICHRCGCTGILTPTLSGELFCPKCHSVFVEQLLLNHSSPPPRSTPTPTPSLIPIGCPPIYSPQPLYAFLGNSSTNHQEPVFRHGRLLDMNLDVDSVLQRILQLRGNNPNWNGFRRAAGRSAVEDLPDVEVDEEISEWECVVCTFKFGNGMEVTQLPCDHLYHRHCILQWLNSKNTCPLCRFPLPIDENQINSGSVPGSDGA